MLLKLNELISCCALLGASPASSPAPVAPAIAPAVDHHQHLISPATVVMINGERTAPTVPVPSEIAELLTRRGSVRTDAAALESLYTPDVQALFTPALPRGWVLGSRSAAAHLSTRLGGAFNPVPTQFGADETTAFVAGYVTTGSGPTIAHHGTFQLGLRKQGEEWRIATETISLYPQSPRYEVIDADRLVAFLDEAGIRRAVVLSGAFGFGGRGFDLYRHVTGPERAARVRAENIWTAEQSGKYPDRLVPFCGLNPLDGFALGELNFCARDGRFRGLKLHLDENEVDLQRAEHVNAVREVFVLANRLRLPIVIHIGNNRTNAAQNVQIFLDRIASAAPNVPIQIAHLFGGGRFSAEALDAYATAVATAHPATRNMIFDVAEIDRAGDAAALQLIAERMRRIGLDRIFYGSDPAMPGHLPPREAWAALQEKLPLTAEEFQRLARNVAPYLR